MSKVAIYTCITAGYDKAWSAENLPEDFEWFCFVPGNEETSRLGLSSPSQANRYFKMHPETLFSEEYEYSLYLDGNIKIINQSFFDTIRKLIKEDVIYAGIKHPQRDDVYQESFRIIRNGRDSISNMKKVTRFLKEEGFPEHYGMMENNIILRKHSDDRIKEFDSLWWDMFTKYPNRDQMTHSYCLWKTGIPTSYIFKEGEDARTSSELEYTFHGSDNKGKDNSIKGKFKDAYRLVAKLIYKKHLKGLGIEITDF